MRLHACDCHWLTTGTSLLWNHAHLCKNVCKAFLFLSTLEQLLNQHRNIHDTQLVYHISFKKRLLNSATTILFSTEQSGGLCFGPCLSAKHKSIQLGWSDLNWRSPFCYCSWSQVHLHCRAEVRWMILIRAALLHTGHTVDMWFV